MSKHKFEIALGNTAFVSAFAKQIEPNFSKQIVYYGEVQTEIKINKQLAYHPRIPVDTLLNFNSQQVYFYIDTINSYSSANEKYIPLYILNNSACQMPIGLVNASTMRLNSTNKALLSSLADHDRMPCGNLEIELENNELAIGLINPKYYKDSLNFYLSIGNEKILSNTVRID